MYHAVALCALAIYIYEYIKDLAIYLETRYEIYLLGRHYVGFEVLIAVVIRSTLFWDVSPYSPENVYLRFGKLTACIFRSKSKFNKQRSA
jgi:hypothetical protein